MALFHASTSLTNKFCTLKASLIETGSSDVNCSLPRKLADVQKGMTVFIVSLTYVAPLETVDQFIPEHVEFLNEQYRLEHFQLSGRKVPRTGGVILATVDGREQLDQILMQDPFHREGLATCEVTEIVPTMSSQALECLVES